MGGELYFCLFVEEMVFYDNGNGARCFFRGVKRIGLLDAYIVANNSVLYNFKEKENVK